MKKLIAFILAMLMAAGCMSGIAEGTGSSEKTAFLRIREGVTAQVYASPGDETAADTLSGGRFCGLIEEKTEAGVAWFHVFYLNSRKEGATGYIHAEDAIQLREDELKAVLEDLGTSNDVLDLIDALNDYLGKQSGSSAAGNDSSSRSSNGGATQKSGFADLYDQAMKALGQVFGTDVSGELEKISDAGKEIAGKAVGAGKDLAEKAGKEVKKVIDDNLPKAKEEFDKLTDNAAEKFKELKDGPVKDLAENAGDALKSLKDGPVKDLVENAGDALKSLKDGPVKNVLENISDTIESLKDGAAKDLLDNVSDTIDSLKKDPAKVLKDTQEKMENLLDNLNKSLGEGTGNALDGLGDKLAEAKKFISSDTFDLIPAAADGLADVFKDSGFKDGAKSVGAILQILGSLGKD